MLVRGSSVYLYSDPVLIASSPVVICRLARCFRFTAPVEREHHLFSNSREDPETAMIFASS